MPVNTPIGTPTSSANREATKASSSVAGAPLDEQLGDRPRQSVADAELAMQRVPHEMPVLHDEGLIEAEMVDQIDLLLAV